MKAIVLIACLMLAGCSASSALSGLVGSKPEISAQAGGENVKQTVGITAKKEDNANTETKIEKSNVGKVDSSTKKTETIKAGTIQADKIEVNNGGSDYLLFLLVGLACGFAIFYVAQSLWNHRNNKGA